jgi:YVTN family beta-propeller protein
MRAAAVALAAVTSAAGGGCGDGETNGAAAPGGTYGPGPGPGPGGAGGGGGGGGAEGGAGGQGGGGAPPVYVLPRPSKSGAIAITANDKLVVMVNPDDDSISVFDTATNTRTAKVPTGDEPSAVVIHPDDARAFVANRADREVVVVSDIGSAAPVLGPSVVVGSEPTGLALSPTGAKLFVASWAEGTVSVVDTATMTVTATAAVPSPRALAVTNDGDTDDDDESLIVPEFFGRPTAEASNTGRDGIVHVLSASALAETATITLAPADSGFTAMGASATTLTAPNQLGAVAIAAGKIYLTSVSASPQAPVAFDQNVHPVAYVADLATGKELVGAADPKKVGTHNLAQLVSAGDAKGAPKFFLADLVDVAFVGDTVAYYLAKGADAVQRVSYNEATGIQIGSQLSLQIDLLGAPGGACKNPIGIVTAHAASLAYVNCWVSRRLAVVDLAMQKASATAESVPPPAQDTLEQRINNGQRFFFTGRGRWSNNAWSSCGSCHPDGLSDNITWAFPAGPRQSTSLDGSFSHGAGAQKQRIFNWTAIFDEVHDFERNTRGVSGGKGAVTTSATNMCGTLAAETQKALGGNLGQPVKEVQDDMTQPTCAPKDWEEIEAYMKSIRPPKALAGLAAADVGAGEALFKQGGCDKCHAGAGWTISRRFWTPSTGNNAALLTTDFPAAPFPGGFPTSWNDYKKEIVPTDTGGLGPEQVACVLRSIGTFGVPGDAAATTALEKKVNGAPAQGQKGYNVPSLYGLALGAPYLHHGQVATLEDLLDQNGKYASHLQAGNPAFAPSAAQVKQLVAFLLSLDAQKSELAVPAGFDVCRASFP